MSTQAITLVKSRRIGSVTRKAVLFVLADYADAEWSSFASQKRIAAEAEVGHRTVRRVVAELEEEGIIRRERRHTSMGYRTSDRLVLVESALNSLPASVAPRDEDDLPATQAARDSEPTGHTGRSYRPTTTVLPATQAGPSGQSLAAQEPSLNRQYEPPENQLGPNGQAEAGRDLLFEAVCRACDIDWTSGLTRSERGEINNAVKQLREIDAQPEELPPFRAAYHIRWPGMDLTPSAIVKWWSKVRAPLPPNKDQVEEYHAEMQRERRRRELAELDAEVKGLER